ARRPRWARWRIGSTTSRRRPRHRRPRRRCRRCRRARTRAMSDPYDPYDLDAGTREHYADADLYDFEYRRRRASVNHYRRVARKRGGPVLELGCGSGRLAIALARDGHRVVGVDRSAEMLARAAAKADKLGRRARARVSWVRGDMRGFAFSERF